MKILFLCLSLFTLLLSAQIDAVACTCTHIPNLSIEHDVTGALKRNKAVFSGEILEIKEIPQSRELHESRELLVRVKVKEIWKGELFKEMTLTTPYYASACGYEFQTGASYLIFASGWDKNKLSTGECSGNGKIEKAAETLKILGKGREPQEKSDSLASRRNCPDIYLPDPETKGAFTFGDVIFTYIFKVQIENADPKLKLTYKWTIYENGELESGQGTPAITVAKVDNRKRVRADVEIGGLEKGCRNTAEGSNY